MPSVQRYSAFISYSHHADHRLAPALQIALQRFAKPWFRRRAMRIFRDATDLSVNPRLWSSILAALNDSDYFVLLASPKAAQSDWVPKEVESWLTNRSTDKLLLVLTEGEIAFNPDGSRLATAAADGRVRVWNVATGQMLLTLSGEKRAFRQVTFSPDGTRLVTTGDQESARVWSAASGQLLLTLHHPPQVTAVTFSPDGALLATVSGLFVKVWDAASGQERATLSGHLNAISALSFHPDSRRLATASQDRTVRVWEARSGRVLLSLSAGSEERFSGVAFSQDGSRLATVGLENLRLYPLELRDLLAVARSFVTRTLTLLECQTYLHMAECPAAP